MPILSLVYLSLQTQWEYPVLTNFTAQQWIDALPQGEILSSLMLSLGISMMLATVATCGGFLLSRSIAQRPSWISLAFYPYLIAPVIFGVMLQYYFVRMELTGTVAGVLLAQLLFILPYSILLYATFWNKRVTNTAFQASTLGASEWQVFTTILLPMARPWMLLCFIQCFLISWFEYGITQVIGVGKINTLTMATMHFVREANPHLAAISSLLMVIPVLLLLGLNRRFFTKGFVLE
jgi:putative spermidine/putrescine transport system permease protein